MLCRATRLWHGSDSNVVPLPCQTKFINYINVFWQSFVRARSYEETTRRILLYGVCALSVTRSDKSNMAAWRRSVHVNEISSAEEQAGDESWNEDEPFDENIPLAGYEYGRDNGEEAASDAESEIRKSTNSESNQAKKKKVGRKSSWKEDDITDVVDIVCNSDYYKKKNYLHEFKKLKKQ